MTPRQRSTYFGSLWPAACAVQRWNAKDEHQRKRVTFAATGEESTSDLNQDQITLLFAKLEWLADPQNFGAALADSDPVAALEANKRKQLIWRIEKDAAKVPGNPVKWLAEIASDRHGTSDWQKLPTPELLRFSFTVSGKTTTVARKRRSHSCSKRSPARPVHDACTAPAAECLELPF